MKEQISENISTKYMRSMCKKPFQLKEEDEIMPFQQKKSVPFHCLIFRNQTKEGGNRHKSYHSYQLNGEDKHHSTAYADYLL